MAGFDELIEKFNEDYGENTAVTADTITEMERVPTGIFPLDLALGGGIPRAMVTEIYGAEGSGKSNIALKTVASHQKVFPEPKNVYVDVEHGFDPARAKRLGVDI